MKSASFIVNPITDFTGDIDDIYFYKRYLSDAEVGQLYSYTAPISYVGVNEITPKFEVVAFPNPAASIVSFSSVEKIKSIELYSLSGQKVLAVTNSNKIDISSFEKGVYLAKVIAEKMRVTIENKVFRYNSTSIDITISVGVSELSAENTSIEDLYKHADKQLYIAKKSGRNKVSLSGNAA